MENFIYTISVLCIIPIIRKKIFKKKNSERSYNIYNDLLLLSLFKKNKSENFIYTIRTHLMYYTNLLLLLEKNFKKNSERVYYL